MEGVTGMMTWLGHVPGRCRGGVYGHADIDKPFFCIVSVFEMEAAGVRSAVPQRTVVISGKPKCVLCLCVFVE